MKHFRLIILFVGFCMNIEATALPQKGTSEKRCPANKEVLSALAVLQKEQVAENSQDIFDLHPEWDSSFDCREKIYRAYITPSAPSQIPPQKKKTDKFDLKAIRKGFSHLLKNIQYLKKPDVIVPHEIKTFGNFKFMKFSENKTSAPVILYFHGGGYLMRYKDVEGLYMDFLSHLTQELQTELYVPFYRVRPENPLSASLEDAYKAYQILVKEMKIDPDKILVMGDSAGGGLALRLLLLLKKKGEKMPKMTVLLSPWTDALNSAASIKENAGTDIFSDTTTLDAFTKSVLGKSNPKDPLISPLYGDYTGFPKLLYAVSKSEIFRDDTLRDVEKAKKQGVEVELIRHDNSPHVYPISGRFLKSGREAFAAIVQKVREAYGQIKG